MLTHISHLNWDKLLSSSERAFMYSKLLDTEFLPLHDLPLGRHYDFLKLQNHPFLKTVRRLPSKRNEWGTIVMLFSRIIAEPITNRCEKHQAKIIKGQKELANITEWIKSSQQLHRALIHYTTTCGELPTKKQRMEHGGSGVSTIQGNKMAILSGLWIYSRAYHHLSHLRNQVISHLISAAIRDMVEGEFYGLKDKLNNPLPPQFDLVHQKQLRPVLSVQSAAIQDWTSRNTLLGGTLLGNSCKCSVVLSGYETYLQYHAYEFGKHFALAFKANYELNSFYSDFNYSSTIFDLTIAPLMLHLEYNPALYGEISKGLQTIRNVNFLKIRDEVSRGPGLALTHQLVKYHTENAIHHLQMFPENDAFVALRNITDELNNIGWKN